MNLTEHQKHIILDAIVAVDEERLRLNSEVSDCVTRGIKLRAHQEKLSRVRDSLTDMLQPSDRIRRTRLPAIPEK